MKYSQQKSISLNHLVPHPHHANYRTEAMQAKLTANMEHTQCYLPIPVRPLDGDIYQVLDGLGRIEGAKALGLDHVYCIIFDVDETIGDLLAASFNAFKGTENPYKRAKLLERLLTHIPEEKLIHVLPETKEQVQDLLKLLKTNEAERTKHIKKILDDSRSALPTLLSFLLPQDDAKRVYTALQHFEQGESSQPQALLAMSNHIIQHFGLDTTCDEVSDHD